MAQENNHGNRDAVDTLEHISSEDLDLYEYETSAAGPIVKPILLGASGLYQWKSKDATAKPLSPVERAELESIEETELPYPIIPTLMSLEDLKMDVDGRYPQMTVSGRIVSGLKLMADWIASVKKSGKNTWEGKIWYKHGTTKLIPHTNIKVAATLSLYPNQQSVTVTFSGAGAVQRTRKYKFISKYFHPVEFEYDTVAGAPGVTSIVSTAHPNHPPGMATETLTIQKIYQRAGFNVTVSPGSGTIPIDMANANMKWSDMEMHDAMQVYWSRFADKPQWAMWVLFASLHEAGTSLGGIMFDDIGPNHRQGTAIFGDAFIATPPTGETHPVEWVERMRFWTAVHEMGHAFNLAHSWQKDYPGFGTSWIPLVNDPEARSFMNYPYNVSGGETAFFADFEYRFIDPEYLFMRHAPAEFVQPGNADWFDNHAFRQAATSPEPRLSLEIRVNRKDPVFEFLEPVVLEFKVKNISPNPVLFNRSFLTSGQDMTVIIKKQGKGARQWIPFAHYCAQPDIAIIDAGKAVYGSNLVSTGINGWDIAEPGIYTVQVALHSGSEDIVSNPLRIKIKPPTGYDEEDLAQDLFSEDVGRVLTFQGSRALDTANDTLRKAVEKLPDRRIAIHAQSALAVPMIRQYKTLEVDGGAKFRVREGDLEEAKRGFEASIHARSEEAAETLGHIEYKSRIDTFSQVLGDAGLKAEAMSYLSRLFDTLERRNVLATVLQSIKEEVKRYT